MKALEPVAVKDNWATSPRTSAENLERASPESASVWILARKPAMERRGVEMRKLYFGVIVLAAVFAAHQLVAADEPQPESPISANETVQAGAAEHSPAESLPTEPEVPNLTMPEPTPMGPTCPPMPDLQGCILACDIHFDRCMDECAWDPNSWVECTDDCYDFLADCELSCYQSCS